MALRLREGLDPGAIEAIEIEATPLILHLVGRPIVSPLEVNYARLCLPFAVAAALLRGRVALCDFAPRALNDPAIHALAARVRLLSNGEADPAAFVPQRMRILLSDGDILEASCDALLGAPSRPLSPAQQRAKLAANLAFGFGAPRPDLAEALVQGCAGLESLADASFLASIAAGRPT